MNNSDIIGYAASQGFSFETTSAAIELYRDDSDYYDNLGLPALMRAASQESAPAPAPYIVRV